MGKAKKQKIIDCKIYSIDYLIERELSEADLYNLFDKNSLLYSFVIGMFRHIGSKMTDEEIIHMAKTQERWVYENYWSQEQKDLYRKKITKAFMNIYQYKEHIADHNAQWFLFSYGLTVK